MIIETTHFGTIEINDETIITFDYGIPGFEDTRRYGIIMGDDKDSPFKWIQSVEKSELAFALVDPFSIRNDYEFDIKDEYVSLLGIEDASKVMVLCIVVVPEDIKMISMNLKAPIIINTQNNKAAQIILDTDKYSVRHYIFEELSKQEV